MPNPPEAVLVFPGIHTKNPVSPAPHRCSC